MTCCDFIKNLKQKAVPPHPVFIFRAADGRVRGEYDPRLGDDAWAGDSDVLHKEIADWYISWDQQDVEAVQFWITVKDADKLEARRYEQNQNV